MLQAVPARRSGLADSTLSRAQEGDAGAFADIVREHQAMVFSIAYHFVDDRSVAEDLAQEVFLRLYRHLGRVGSAAHLTFWLRRVASHCCIDWFRRRAPHGEVSLGDAPEVDSLVAVPMPPVNDFMLEERLRRLVSRLSARARLVVTLRYQEDLEPSEIAAILEMPINTVKSHLRRSIDQLRAWLDESGGVR